MAHFSENHNMLRKPIVDRIIAVRKERGLSQEELASRSGLDRTYISGVERMKRNITLDSLSKILKGLKMSPEKFFEDVRF